MGFPGGSDGKETACNAGDLGSDPGLGRSPGGGHGNPLQDSCLESPHRGAWRAVVHGIAELDTLSDKAHYPYLAGLLKQFWWDRDGVGVISEWSSGDLRLKFMGAMESV